MPLGMLVDGQWTTEWTERDQQGRFNRMPTRFRNWIKADICLFTTLFRFDAVYHGHFKCNLRRIIDYPNLWNYLKDIYQYPGVKETCNLDHIKRNYYKSQTQVNPTRIVPKGLIIDFEEPHNRDQFLT